MNEIDFAALSRTFHTGDLILFSQETRNGDGPLEPCIPSSTGAGFVLRFVDPAKPLLVYKTVEQDGEKGEAGGIGVDFFQDVLYASSPHVEAKYFSLWRTRRGIEEVGQKRWLSYLEGLIGHPLNGDTPLFSAYQAGALSASYREGLPDCQGGGGAPESLASWIASQLELFGLGLSDFDSPNAEYDIWKGHDVYHFC